jgi:signal transduction histidine kinase
MYIEFPPHISLDIVGDFPSLNMNPTHFQQLIQNFITNAIKYNDKEKGTVRLIISETSQYHSFSVEDNGRGIDKRNQDKIFDMFQKFDAEGKSSSGIGLAIVKKIVELYQGKVSLQSEVGKGSTFTFYLPKN